MYRPENDDRSCKTRYKTNLISKNLKLVKNDSRSKSEFSYLYLKPNTNITSRRMSVSPFNKTKDDLSLSDYSNNLKIIPKR